MSKIFIDFDGVILDTWDVIFKIYYEKFKSSEINDNELKKLMIDIGWDFILKNSKEINFSISKIKTLSKKYDVWILTKINSSQEKTEKTKFFKRKNLKKFLFVPYECSKTKYVDVCNNILIDDDLKNLEEWEKQNGVSVFFNKDLDGYDCYGRKNNKFLIINDLFKIYDIM